MDKIQLIKQEIERLFDGYPMSRGMLKHLTIFIDSLPEEPVSEDLRTAAIENLESVQGKSFNSTSEEQCFRVYAFEAGAKWKKQQMIEKAVEWIQNNIAKDFCFDEDLRACIPEFIEEFKKAIED